MNKLIIVLCFIFSAHLAEAKKMYKWVDEDGRVHYSDKVPPDQVKLAREELNKEGVVTEKVSRAKTEEELAAETEAQRLLVEKAELERLQAEKEKKERNAVLKSYVSEDQIIRIKEERLEALARNISMAQENLAIQQRNHTDLLQRAADLERSGEKVSEAFMGQIDTIQTQIEYQEKYITSKQEEVAETENKYDGDLQKYRKYSGKPTAQTAEKSLKSDQ